MSVTTNAAPGGWQDMYGVKVAKKLVVGTTTLAAALLIYGSFQGRQAVHYAEVDLDPVSKSGAQIAAWAWPLSETGVIIPDHQSYAYFDVVPSPASQLKIGVGTATSTGATVATIRANAAGALYTLLGSGTTIGQGDALKVGPGQYVTFSWYAGSGQTTTGLASGVARVKVEPCGTSSFTCD